MTVSQFQDIGSAAASLEHAQHGANIFQTTDWLALLLADGLDRNGQTELPAWPAETPSAMLPLRRKGRAMLACANYYASLFGPVGTSPLPFDDVAQSLGCWLRAQPIDSALFEPIDKDDKFWSAFASALSNGGFWVDHFFVHGNWYLPCAGLSWNDYLAARPSRLKNTIQRKSKKLASEPGYELDIVQGVGPDLEKAIEDFVAVYSKSWKVPEPFPRFVPNLCRLAGDRGWLRLGVLRLNGVATAAQLWLVKDGVAYIYKLAYDEAFGKLGVGTALSAALTRHVLDVDHVHEIDFLTGDDPYKVEWMSHRRVRSGMVAFRKHSVRGQLSALRHFGPKLWKRLVRNKSD